MGKYIYIYLLACYIYSELYSSSRRRPPSLLLVLLRVLHYELLKLLVIIITSVVRQQEERAQFDHLIRNLQHICVCMYNNINIKQERYD